MLQRWRLTWLYIWLHSTKLSWRYPSHFLLSYHWLNSWLYFAWGILFISERVHLKISICFTHNHNTCVRELGYVIFFWLEKNLAMNYCWICLVLLFTLTWSYILCKKKFRNGGSRPALSFLKKELQDEYLSTPPKGSPHVNSSAAVETDSFFLPFFYNPRLSVKPEVAKPSSEAIVISSSSQDCDSKRYAHEFCLASNIAVLTVSY